MQITVGSSQLRLQQTTAMLERNMMSVEGKILAFAATVLIIGRSVTVFDVGRQVSEKVPALESATVWQVILWRFEGHVCSSEIGYRRFNANLQSQTSYAIPSCSHVARSRPRHVLIFGGQPDMKPSSQSGFLTSIAKHQLPAARHLDPTTYLLLAVRAAVCFFPHRILISWHTMIRGEG